MSLDHQITKKAADGSLTISDLREFLDEYDKATAESGPPSYTGSLKPKVTSAVVVARGGVR